MDKEQIKALRKKYGLTKKKLGEICGVSQRTVEGWEQGRSMSKSSEMLLKTWVKEREFME